MADSAKSSSSRIAFTLPLSCQICLGKVKLPVVCPNQHVFCSPCMDVWLQRNQQCPSCRVPITAENPCKKILGGLSQQDEEQTSFSKSKELRRSRLEILCKDYEDEIERLQMESDSLQQENRLLEEQVKSYASQKLKDAEDDVGKGKASSSSTSPQPDMNMLMMLTKKLQDATGLYERVKRDMDKLKQENSNLKDENAGLTRENQRVRSELTGRSPRKFGRITVATLETKLEKQEKEVTQLQKALERSDAYIEEVEKELESYRKKIQGQNTCIRCKCTLQVEKAKGNEDSQRGGSKEGNAGSTNVEVSNAESSSSHAPLRRGQSLDRGEASYKLRGEGLQPSTSKDDWRKLPNDVSKMSQSVWKPSSNNVAEEKKDSLTACSFYGKRPLAKEDKTRLGQSKLSHRSVTAKVLDDSFELEMPSPTSSSVVSSTEAVGRIRMDNERTDTVSTSDLRNLTPNDSTIDLGPNDTLASASSVESCKKRLRYESDISDVSGLSFLNSPKKGAGGKKTSAASGSGKQVTFNNNVAVKNMIKKRSAHSDSVLDITLPSDTSEVDILNDIKPSRKQNMSADESYDANMSMNSDIMDCMELFSGAEKRLGQVKKNDNVDDNQTVQNYRGQESAQQQGYSAPPLNSAAAGFLHTYPPPSQHTRSHGLPGGSDYGGASSGSYAQGARPVSSSVSSSATLSSFGTSSRNAMESSLGISSRNAMDNVSSSVDPYKAYTSSSRSYSDQNHSTKGSDHITSSRVSEPQNLKSSGLTNFSNYQPSSMQGHSSAGSGGMVGALPGFAAGGLGGGGGIPPSLCTDSLMTQAFPPRPASTSTLQGMIHTLNSLDEEPSSRPLSAPGTQSTASSNNWRNTYAPSTGISSSSDFRPSSSVSSMPPASRSTYSGLSLSQGSMGGLPGGMGGAGGSLGSGLSASQSSINGLSGYPGMSAGAPPMLPGMGGLSQPTGRYGNDFGTAGLFSLGSSSSGMMPGFSGGMTQ